MPESPIPPVAIPVAGPRRNPPRPAHTNLTCPVCGSARFELVEVRDATTVFKTTGGWLDLNNGYTPPPSAAARHLLARCGCGHQWLSPDGMQLAELVREPIKEPA